MIYRKDRNENRISQFGPGCMRFPKKGAGIDFEKAEKQVLCAIDKGIKASDEAMK